MNELVLTLGDGTDRFPYALQGLPSEKGNLREMFAIAERRGSSVLKVGNLGTYYELRDGVWYLDGETQSARLLSGIPAGGRRVAIAQCSTT